MSECMISTPNLEGGVNSSDIITRWALITLEGDANTTSYINLPFSVSHLYYMNSTGTVYVPYRPVSNDLVESGTHEIATYASSRIYAYVTYEEAYNRIIYKPSISDIILNYIAIPA